MSTAGTLSTAVLAHQGGWDEIIFVLLPMVVLAGLLWLAKRRAERESEDEAGTPAATSETSLG